MGQVPNIQKKYLIIGGGRLATHLASYFKLIDIPFHQWTRKNNQPLSSFLDISEKILLAVSDDAIESLSQSISNKIIIHFSGALTIAKTQSVHPLFTFGYNLYDKKTYMSIPFITEKGGKSFKTLFPELENTSFSINQKDKILYHAWASIAGNFSSILITEYVNKLVGMGLPYNLATPYLSQMLHNSIESSKALTGPINRGDSKTIKKHLDAIDKEFQVIYNAFLTLKNNQIL